MPCRRSIGWAVATLLVPVVTAAARGADEPKVKTERDIPYTKAGGAELKLDIASPEQGRGAVPGGPGDPWRCLRAGDKGDVGGVLREFAAHGYVAVSPQYRFCPKELFPAQVHDVKAAVRWMKAHAKERRIDPERIGAIGFSAGGHLALMLGVTGPGDGLEGDVSAGAPDTRIRAVVNYFGPTDLGAKDIPDVSKPLVQDFLGAAATDKPELAAKASPRTYVTRDDAPILTFQGTKDPLVPHTQAIVLAEAMSAAGSAGPRRADGRGRARLGRSEMDHTLAETFGFFDQYLKPTASPKGP